MKLTVFFSWQTETEKLGFNNKSLLIEALSSAIKAIQDKGKLKGIFFELREGLTKEPGTPDVAEKMFEQADNCDIFVGDFTVVQRVHPIVKFLKKHCPKIVSFRYSPNSNVIAEYSRAQRNAPDFYKQIILVANNVNGIPEFEPECIPFDFRGKRWPIFFNLKDNDTQNKEFAKETLKTVFTKALRQCAGPAIEYRLTKYRPFKSWSELGAIKPFKGSFIVTDVLNGYLEIIKKARILRILGLSGLGKSRIVYEAFRDPELSQKFLYYDCKDEDRSEVKTRLVADIFKNFKEAVIVLDNCDSYEFHEYLALWRNHGNPCRLIAISNNPLEQSISGVEQIRIDRHLEEVVEKMLSRAGIVHEIIDQIKELSGGIPLMGELMAEALRDGKPIGQLSDTNIINKILGISQTDRKRSIYQTLSLFDYLGWEKELRGEIEYVATNKHITSIDHHSDVVLLNEFDEVIIGGLDKQIMERKGRKVGIRPIPISLHLIDEWLNTCTDERLLRVLQALMTSPDSDSLMRAFRTQFSQLDFNPRAQMILQRSLDVGGPFDSAEVLNTKFGSELLRTFADITPSSVLSLFDRKLAVMGTDRLLEIKEGRREIVWTLEKLAFRTEFFDKSAFLLMRLAIAENESISNNATGQFLSLFPILLASTEVDLNRRLDFLRRHSADPENVSMILRALKSALKTSDFIFFRGPEKIGRVSKNNYEPSEKEVETYFAGCLGLLCELGSEDNKTLSKAAGIFKDTFMGLCRVGYDRMALDYTKRISSMMAFDWDDMYDTLSLFEDSVGQSIPQESQAEYRILKDALRKHDIVSRFRRIEKDHTGNWNEPFEKSLERQQRAYEALAGEWISGEGYDRETLRLLMMLQPSFSAPFGQTLAKKLDVKAKKTVLKDCIDLVNTVESINPRIAQDFIAGLTDEEYNANLPLILTISNHRLLFGVVGNRGLGKSNPGLSAIEQMVRETKVASSNFINLYINLPLQSQKTEDLFAWLGRIVDYKDGLETVFEIGQRMVMFKEAVSTETLDFFKRVIMDNQANPFMTDCQAFWSVTTRLLDMSDDADLTKAVTEILLQKIDIPETIVEQNYLLQELTQVLMDKHFRVSWPLISSALVKEDTNAARLLNLRTLLFDTFSQKSRIDTTAHKAELLAFCDSYPAEAPQFVMAITGWNGPDGGFSTLTKELIDRFGNNKTMLMELSCQMNSFVSEGSVLPYYRQRKAACESLIGHSNPNVARWALAEVDNYDRLISANKDLEEEQF